nr:helix-turn-helix domain-containing protein [Marinoscillum pacificum]
MTEKLAIDKEYRSTLFFFDNQHLLNFFLNYQTLIDSVSPITSQEKPFLVFPKDDFIMNYISSLRIIQRKPSDILPLLLQIKFEELMLYLLEKNPQQMMSFKSKMQEEYSEMEIKKAVEENITNNLTLNELAFLCHTSISTFKRKFVKLYKTTPSKYFLQRKMQIAASMLLQNENPSEIFYKVGYENHSSFSQSFKRIYGLSPKHFQKQRMTVSKQLLSD